MYFLHTRKKPYIYSLVMRLRSQRMRLYTRWGACYLFNLYLFWRVDNLFFAENSPSAGFSPLGPWQYSLSWFFSLRFGVSWLQISDPKLVVPKYCRGVNWAEICLVQYFPSYHDFVSLFQIEEDDGTSFRQDHATGTITRILTTPAITQAKSFSEKSYI